LMPNYTANNQSSPVVKSAGKAVNSRRSVL